MSPIDERERPASSPQRRVLVAVAVLAVAGALAVTGSTTDLTFGAFSAGVTLLALLAMANPDSSVPLAVIGLVVIRWAVSDGSPASPAALVIAVALTVFHAAAALAAAVPATATVPVEIVRRWVVRTSVVVGVTTLWWVVLAVLDGREAGPSRLATLVALVVLVVALVMQRAIVTDPDPDDAA